MSRTRKLIICAVVAGALLISLIWLNMFHEGSSLEQTGFSSTQTTSAEK